MKQILLLSHGKRFLRPLALKTNQVLSWNRFFSRTNHLTFDFAISQSHLYACTMHKCVDCIHLIFVIILLLYFASFECEKFILLWITCAYKQPNTIQCIKWNRGINIHLYIISHSSSIHIFYRIVTLKCFIIMNQYQKRIRKYATVNEDSKFLWTFNHIDNERKSVINEFIPNFFRKYRRLMTHWFRVHRLLFCLHWIIFSFYR